MKKNVFDKNPPPITLHIYILLKILKLLKAVYLEKEVIEYRRNRQTLWGGCTDANPKLLLNDT